MMICPRTKLEAPKSRESLGKIGQNASVSKANQLHVEFVWFF